jgi:leucyl aminopeptidase
MQNIAYSVKHAQASQFRTDCLVIPYNGKVAGGMIEHKVLRNQGMTGMLGQLLLVNRDDLPGKILFIGVGAEPLTEYQYEDILAKSYAILTLSGAQDVLFCLNDFNVNSRSLTWKIKHAVQIIENLQYRFDAFKSKQVFEQKTLKRCAFQVTVKSEISKAQKSIELALAICEGMTLAKDLANTPSNVCTPAYLANEAKKLAKQCKNITCAVLDEKQIKALGMGLFLSVSQASKQPPKLITLSYRHASKETKPIVLVGKGITFDTGGNTIKIPPNMIGMKYDMCGAATVLGVFKAVHELALPINLIGVIPSCENRIGSTATNPEDIIRSMSGNLVEILNTDAEGRLILADALSYCERYHPQYVIDIATLTGACLLALGPFASGLMGNHEPLLKSLYEAGMTAHDRVWTLPLWNDYHEALRSEHADFSNVPLNDIGGRTIVAGCFLSKFAKKYPWAHLDIANTASMSSGLRRGATGRPIPLLVQFLKDHVDNKKN